MGTETDVGSGVGGGSKVGKRESGLMQRRGECLAKECSERDQEMTEASGEGRDL